MTITTNPFQFITIGTEIPAFDQNYGASSADGQFTMGAHYGATYSDVIIRFTVAHREAGMMVLRIDADRRVTEVVRTNGPAAPTLRSGRMSGEWVRVDDGKGCTEMVQA